MARKLLRTTLFNAAGVTALVSGSSAWARDVLPVEADKEIWAGQDAILDNSEDNGIVATSCRTEERLRDVPISEYNH